MKKGTLIVILTTVPILIVVEYLVLAHIMDARDARVATAKVETIKGEIAKELPIGTDKDKILSFLISRQMKHSDITKCLPSDTRCKDALFIDASVSIAIEPHSWTNINIRFYLNDAGILQDREITESKTAD